jgi:hypothetical protein
VNAAHAPLVRGELHRRGLQAAPGPALGVLPDLRRSIVPDELLVDSHGSTVPHIGGGRLIIAST